MFCDRIFLNLLFDFCSRLLSSVDSTRSSEFERQTYLSLSDLSLSDLTPKIRVSTSQSLTDLFPSLSEDLLLFSHTKSRGTWLKWESQVEIHLVNRWQNAPKRGQDWRRYSVWQVHIQWLLSSTVVRNSAIQLACIQLTISQLATTQLATSQFSTQLALRQVLSLVT